MFDPPPPRKNRQIPVQDKNLEAISTITHALKSHFLFSAVPHSFETFNNTMSLAQYAYAFFKVLHPGFRLIHILVHAFLSKIAEMGAPSRGSGHCY